jgi:hypothetical protein
MEFPFSPDKYSDPRNPSHDMPALPMLRAFYSKKQSMQQFLKRGGGWCCDYAKVTIGENVRE